MLIHLSIRDFAIIEKLELELEAGLTVLTGETGAGKSIVVDALSIVLGERADAEMIRHGAEQADIAADFELPAGHAVHALLDEMELGDAGGCLLRRTLARSGRARAFINGRPATLQQLKQVGDLVADIYGQHAHQSLMSADAQRELLDAYADNQATLKRIRQAFRDWQGKRETLARLRENQAERDARLDLLAYQLSEFEQIDPKAGELEALEQECAVLAASHQLQDTASHALDRLYEGDQTASNLLGTLVRRLGELTPVDPRLEEITELLNGALIQVDEAAGALRNYLGHLDSDPARLEQVNERLDQLHALLRKHHCDYPALLAKRAQLVLEHEQVLHLSDTLQNAEAELARSTAAYRELAEALRQSRQTAAQAFGRQVSEQIRELGMPKGNFLIRVDGLAADAAPFRPHGIDNVDFLVSANPGLPPKELNKVASGGELSRISLAIQVVLAGRGVIDTLVFDEVDVGVGGAVAEIVGRRLRQLGARKQIFCITHLPQVAAQGHHHLQVSKVQGADYTLSTLIPLNKTARVEELARMLGGVTITEQTRAMAMEMLGMAEAR